MENPNLKKQIKVGSFIVAGLTIIMGSILALGGGASLFRSTYTLKMVLESVQGISAGSVVSLSGLTVGNVAVIDFAGEKNQLTVELRIDEKYRGRITKGSLADIRTQGALGDKFVYITPGPAASPPLPEDSYIETTPSSDLLDVISSRSSELERVFDILKEIHIFTQALNKDGRTEKLMANLSDASGEMKLLAREGRNLIAGLQSEKSLAGSLARFDRILAKVENGEGTLGQLINDPALHNRLKNFLGGSSRSEQTNSLLRSAIRKKEEVRSTEPRR